MPSIPKEDMPGVGAMGKPDGVCVIRAVGAVDVGCVVVIEVLLPSVPNDGSVMVGAMGNPDGVILVKKLEEVLEEVLEEGTEGGAVEAANIIDAGICGTRGRGGMGGCGGGGGT